MLTTGGQSRIRQRSPLIRYAQVEILFSSLKEYSFASGVVSGGILL